jgi:HSP90 family molecular chaperone
LPVKVDGKKANTVEAIWLHSKSEIKDEEYDELQHRRGPA